jgi:hypothetical protein
MMLRSTLVVCFLLLGAEVMAQQPGVVGGTSRPQGPLPGGRMQRPPRDPREAPTGTSVIRGRIVAADTGSPIRRVQVRAFSGEMRESRATSTDAQGRFEFRDLPAGRWEIMASKAGFVSLRFGQRRPLEAGRPIELGEGETMAKADMALPRGGAITGKILDEFGDPVAGARVQAMRYRTVQGARQLGAMNGDSTDDTGAFRVYGLQPGDYYITAYPQMGMFGGEESNDPTTYAPTYFPGTANVAEAQRVTVAVGQDVTNVTFSLLATKAVRVTGTVTDSKGERVANGFVMMQEVSEMSRGMFMGRPGGRLRPDGTFTVSNITAGTYQITINTGMGGGPGGEDSEIGIARVTVGNEDLTGINITTNKGGTVSGSLLAAAGSAGNLTAAGLMVMQQQPQPMMMMGMGMRPAKVEADGTFKITGVLGPRLFRVMNLPPNWMLKSVTLNGDDITDKEIEFKGNEEISGLQILVTDQVPEVNGKVTDAKGQPTRDYTVIVFPDDPSKWDFPSRFIRSGRADQEGLFKIRGLPPGDDYLAVAVDFLEEGEGGDPDFLHQMRERATPLRLGDGETKALDLKLINR